MKDFNVVLVDDDIDLLDAMKLNLQNDFRVQTFSTHQNAMTYIDKNNFDAIVLDFHMPEKNSFEFYKQVRDLKHRQPILFLTGDSTPEIKIAGLEMGADDFLHKPISIPELSAYLRNRIKNFRNSNPKLIKIQNLEINVEFPEVWVDGVSVVLTRKEFQILTILATNMNNVVDKEVILKSVWKDVVVEKNNLDTHISNLRKKIGDFTGKIKTLKGFGYVLRG